MRRTIITAIALVALAIPSAALAQAPDPPDTQPATPTLLPTPAPPTTPVTDEAGAGVFAKAFVIANAGDLIPGSRAIQVDNAGCRQVDAVQRFYCLLTARVVTVQRIVIVRFFRDDRNHGRHHDRSHSRRARAAGDVPGGDWTNNRDRDHNRPVRVVIFRVRLWACVAVVRIQGGPSVAPTATLPVRDCVRVDRGPQPTPLV